MAHNSGRFHFDGGAVSFVRTAICAALVTVGTFGFGVYSFWVIPRIQQWRIENTDFDPAWRANNLSADLVQTLLQASPTPLPCRCA